MQSGKEAEVTGRICELREWICAHWGIVIQSIKEEEVVFRFFACAYNVSIDWSLLAALTPPVIQTMIARAGNIALAAKATNLPMRKPRG